MRYQFLNKADKITRHYGIRPVIFEGSVAAYAVVMLSDPEQVILCFIKRPAAVHHCVGRERAYFGADSVEE